MVIVNRALVIKEGNMILSNKEMLTIKGGGWSISSFNTFTVLMTKLYEFGRAVGSNLYRLRTRRYC